MLTDGVEKKAQQCDVGVVAEEQTKKRRVQRVGRALLVALAKVETVVEVNLLGT
jgi:hypothetical protein